MAERKYEYVCKKCGAIEILPHWRYNRKKYKDLCAKCAKEKGYENFKKLKYENPQKWKKYIESCKKGALNKHAKTTKEERVKHAKKMRSSVKISGAELRKRQQNFIDMAGDEYYQKYCKKRSEIAKKFHNGMTDKEKELHYQKIFKNKGKSKACEKFIETLKEHGILCKPEKYINGFIVDAIVHDTNIIIEFYGDIFHCNPRKFKDPLQYCSWIGRTVQEQWDRDKKRLAVFYKLGYTVIVIWEDDWNKEPIKCIERIRDEVHKNRIY